VLSQAANECIFANVLMEKLGQQIAELSRSG
jgi:hypothetical protein